MNQTKKTILGGEARLSEAKSVLKEIDAALLAHTDETEPGVVILKIERLKFTEKIAAIQSKLDELNKRYIGEFERESVEANTNMEKTILRARQYVGKEPLGVSERIAEDIAALGEAPYMEQEKKNDLYFGLLAHIKFFKENVRGE